MRAATTPSPTSEHPPLARDAAGNLVSVPEGTLAWRLCRHTGGRPRVVHGPDREPLRVPLDVTPEDVLDLCGPDTYRVYALDEVGNVLDYVTTVEVGLRHRNAAPEPEPQAFTANRGQSNDLRYALEAITHMARTCADSLRAVSEAQADWVKTIAMAKGLPRNVAMPLPMPDRYDEEDDEEEADDAELAPQQGGIEAITKMIAPYVPGLMENWSAKKASSQPNAMGHLARIQGQLTPNERAFLDVLLQDSDSEAIAADLSSRTVEDAVAMIRREVMKPAGAVPFPAARKERAIPRLDPALMQKVAAVAALLQPDERARLMKLGPKLMGSTEAIELAETLVPLSTEAAAEWVRSNLDEIERRFAS